MKKRKKITPARKLFIKAERLWKQIAFLRDGRECKVQVNYPQIRIHHSEILQVDHCFSRNDKNLFFNPRNSTVICSSCNAAKGFKNKSVDRAIDQIVIGREGGEVFGAMQDINQTHMPNTNWGQVWWLEQVVKELEEYKKGLGVVVYAGSVPVLKNQ